MMQWVRSVLFVGQMYGMMAVMGLAFLPWVILTRRGAFVAVHTYTKWVRWSAGWIVGLKSEIRGDIPTGEVLIASKHQSFFDIIMIISVIPRPKFIMKSSLRWVPIVGYYARRIGCVPVDRGKRSEAIRTMVAQVQDGLAHPGQLIIFPQGTRVPPGVKAPYKIGVAALYHDTGQACVPAATNVGQFWPRTGILRKPGLAVVEFLPPIAPGLDNQTFMEKIETQIEDASDRLMLGQ
jgi:1-acyl-sn-glycerol-3-phosphate acyltransferase